MKTNVFRSTFRLVKNLSDHSEFGEYHTATVSVKTKGNWSRSAQTSLHRKLNNVAARLERETKLTCAGWSAAVI